ncbi:MAG TPA: ATP-binding protein [Candidatus Methanoperedens sp.]|nr:ATP-binding protein [Candidatus Methanoperedens sp.]
MRTISARFASITRLEVSIAAVLAMWTAIAGGSWLWNCSQVRQNTLEEAHIQARVVYEKDVIYRDWNTMHGGVYVAVTPENRPNPFLAGNPDRDVTTTSGRQLTLMNPFYMTRQANEAARRAMGVRGHITSLNPIRPGNAPDPWERHALQSFDRGAKEAHGVELFDGVEYMRFMQPMLTEPECLQCHAKQGYRVGQVRGGISVAVPMEPLRIIERRDIVRLSLVHGVLWLVGLLGGILGGRSLVLSQRERRQAAEQVERYAGELEEANGLKELFIDIMRHDFLNPASAVQSCSMYLQEGASDPKTRKLAAHITQANAKLIEMIQDASMLSRLSEADKLECAPRDLNRLIREAIRDIESPLAVDYPPAGAYPITANPILGNVFVNLLTNAIKYAPGGGRVEIGIRDAGTDWLASVKDFGPGIKDEDKPKVFTRFERLKREGVQGTGLGLAIARRIVELHQGRIWVEDNPAGGAIFCVSLPKAVATETAP